MNLNLRLIRYAVSSKNLLILAVTAGFFAGIATIFQARQLSSIIGRVHLEGASLEEVSPFFLTFLICLLLRAVFSLANEIAASSAASLIKEELGSRLVEYIMRLGPSYTQSERSGELINTANQGIEAIDAYFSQFLPQLALAGMLPVAYVLIVIPNDPISAGILLLTGPLIPLFMFLIGHKAQTLTKRQWTALGRMSDYFLDTLQGLATLKALGRSGEQAEKIYQVSGKYRDTTLSVLRVTFLSALALELLGTMGTALIAVQIGLRLLYGQIAFEQAFFILLLAPDFYQPLRALGLRFHASMSGVSAARKIFEVLDQPVSKAQVIQNSKEEIKLSLPYDINFQNICFTYPGRKLSALESVDLDFNYGRITALVGASGSGKSTVIKLILRFISPDSGHIFVNGIDLVDIPVDKWRSQISWVPQQPHIFHGTITDNLKIARSDAKFDDLIRAARQAHLLDWINSLPFGFDTQVGEEGARLSAGQIQRLALARAFLRDAPILLLDEPTAHLDVDQEQLLKETTRELCQGRTVLIIAHRLPSVMSADQVIMLDSGRVIEKGAPNLLINNEGSFSRLIAAYSGKDVTR